MRKHIALLPVLALLAACGHDQGPVAARSGFIPNNHLERNPIKVGYQVETMDILIDVNGVIAQGAAYQLQSFLNRFEQSGAKVITAQVPAGPHFDTVTDYLSALLAERQYNGGPIDVVSYHSPHAGQVQLSFQHPKVTAYTKGCDALTQSLEQNSQNQPNDYFGCATRNNLAAMISNPNDLVTPRNMGTVSTKRRMELLKQYETPEKAEPVQLSENRKTFTTGN